jgi:hypothetical protein
LSYESMGKETLFLLLEPPTKFREHSFSGPWFDSTGSNVIQVGRCYIKDGLIRSGRFWYSPQFFNEGIYVKNWTVPSSPTRPRRGPRLIPASDQGGSRWQQFS